MGPWSGASQTRPSEYSSTLNCSGRRMALGSRGLPCCSNHGKEWKNQSRPWTDSSVPESFERRSTEPRDSPRDWYSLPLAVLESPRLLAAATRGRVGCWRLIGRAPAVVDSTSPGIGPGLRPVFERSSGARRFTAAAARTSAIRRSNGFRNPARPDPTERPPSIRLASAPFWDRSDRSLKLRPAAPTPPSGLRPAPPMSVTVGSTFGSPSSSGRRIRPLDHLTHGPFAIRKAGTDVGRGPPAEHPVRPIGDDRTGRRDRSIAGPQAFPGRNSRRIPGDQLSVAQLAVVDVGSAWSVRSRNHRSGPRLCCF